MACSLRAPIALACLWALSSCGGTDTADALIGPEGGVVSHDDGITLTVPPGALLTTRQIVIRPSSDDLTRDGYKMVGKAYLFEPRDLEFKIPAELAFDGDADKPVVLLKPGEKRVIAYSGADDRAVAYIGTLGVASLGSAGDPIATVDKPTLARSPAEVDLGGAAINTAELTVTPVGLTAIDIGFTAFNPSGMSAAQLNGEGTHYCGFKPGMILGASITNGCSNGLASATLNLSAPSATVQVVPFLIGKVSEPVIVEVQVGDGDIAQSLGYFPFKTSACYLESCSGKGTCSDGNGTAPAVCDCVDGYEANGLACMCIPQCDGRQCGGDACNGSCGDCGAEAQCDNDAGQCVPLPPPETTGPDPDTTAPPPMTSTGPDDTSTGAPDPSTTTGGSTADDTTGGSTGGSTGTTG